MFTFLKGEKNNLDNDKYPELELSILNCISDGFFFVDNDWTVLFWNKSAAEIMGIPKNEIAGKNLWDVFADSKETDFFYNCHQSKEENKPIEFDTTYAPKDLSFNIKTSPFDHGLAVYFTDVTIKKRLALEIEKTKTEQEAIINATKDSIWSINPRLELIHANAAYIQRVQHVTGISLKPGDNVLSGYAKEVVAKRKGYYERALTGETFTIEDRLPDYSTNSIKFIEVNFNPIVSNKGEITGVTCFSRDITQRREYEILIEEKNAELRERERLLQEVYKELDTVLNSSLDLICSIDKDGRFVHVNDACESLLGYHPEELRGVSFQKFVHPEDIVPTMTVRNKILNGGKVTAFRNRFVKKSGKELHIMWSSHWDAKKQRMFAVGRDASTLVQAELLKEKAEKRYAALIEKGADMIGIVNKEGYYTYTSPNTEKILGYKENQLLHKNAFELIHPDDAALIQKQFEAILISGEIKKAELRMKDALGDWRWVEIVGTNLLDDPAVEGIVINSRDITERKIEAEKHKTTNERFKTVLDITRDVIWEWDIASGTIYNNKNYEKIFGYHNEEEVPVNSWIGKIHKTDADRVKGSMLAKIENRDTTIWKEEYRFIRANGEVAYVVDTGILIMDKRGQPVRMVGSIHDITERKIIENEREKVIRELTESIRDLKQFSFIISHNLRAPLSNILGILNVFDASALCNTNKALLEFLKITTLQLEETIKDLTSIIVIRNNVKQDNELISIPEVFESTGKIYLNPFNDIPYSLDSHFEAKEVYINKSYLESIFTNLFSNAIKYRSAERQLAIEVSTMLVANDTFQLRFSDNGMGLDTKRLQNRLFGMYQRFHSNEEGKGLGLFMVKSQVTAMGGTITMEGEENGGCTVTIVLPLKKDQGEIFAGECGDSLAFAFANNNPCVVSAD